MSMIKCYAVSTNTRIERKFLNLKGSQFIVKNRLENRCSVETSECNSLGESKILVLLCRAWPQVCITCSDAVATL